MAHAAFIVLVALASAAPADEPPRTAYVQVDVAAVHASPSETAPLVAKLRINNSLKVISTHGDWSEVKLSSPATTGFVPSAQLGSSRLTLASLKDRAAKSKGAERVAALQRLLALEPDRAERYSELVAEYRASEQPERAGAVERTLKAEAPAHMLACVAMPGDRPRLGAVLLGHTVQQKRADEIAKEGQSAPELRMGWELAGSVWMKLGANGPKLISGNPFAAPTGFHPLPQNADPAYGLELGRCESEGDLYVIAPARSATPTREELARLAEKKLLPDAKTKILWFRAGLGDSPLRGVFPYALGVHHESGTAFSGYRMLVVPATGDVEEIDYEVYSVGGG